MDYIGRRRGDFHLNWSGHSYVGGALSLLGADLAEWSGDNDGRHVKAATCRAWAAILRDALASGRLQERTMSVAAGPDGGVEVAVVKGARPPAIGSVAWQLDLIYGRFGYTVPGEAQAIAPDFATVITDFAAFLASCGGCRQW